MVQMRQVLQAANDGPAATIALRRPGLYGRLEAGRLTLQRPADRTLIDSLRGCLSIEDLARELDGR